MSKSLEFYSPSEGALAQLVERNDGIVEASGSTPLRSIFQRGSMHKMLTVSQAADLLKVSGACMTRLLDQEQIPSQESEGHRQILFQDLCKYREKSKAKSKKARRELIKQAQLLNLGY